MTGYVKYEIVSYLPNIYPIEVNPVAIVVYIANLIITDGIYFRNILGSGIGNIHPVRTGIANFVIIEILDAALIEIKSTTAGYITNLIVRNWKRLFCGLVNINSMAGTIANDIIIDITIFEIRTVQFNALTAIGNVVIIDINDKVGMRSVGLYRDSSAVAA